MSFDLCVAYPHLENTLTFVKKCPNVRFIVDHIGKPDIKEHMWEPWASKIKEMAALDNVHCCKISGMVCEADMQKWTKEDLVPYVEYIIETFGIDRVCFGGDWPVVLNASPYKRWYETLRDILKGYSDTELKKIFETNAKDFYKVD